MSARSGRLSDKEKEEHYFEHIQKTKRTMKIGDRGMSLSDYVALRSEANKMYKEVTSN